MFIECIGVCLIAYVCLSVMCNCNKNIKSIYYDEVEGETIRSDY